MYLYRASIRFFLLVSLVFFVNGELRLPRTEENPLCKDDSFLGFHVNLTNVEITKVRENFLVSPLVTCLTLRDNLIWKIDRKAFRGLPNLHYLDLAGNNLPHDTFDYDLSTIKTLVLDNAIAQCQEGRQIRSKENEQCAKNNYYYNGRNSNNLRFPILSKLPNLEKLYLRDNGLLSLSLNRRMSNITHLYLENNRINPEELIRFIPHTLTHLSLSSNFIEQFPHAPIFLQLEELILEDNSIQFLCYDYNCFEDSSQMLQDPEFEPMESPWDNSNTDRSMRNYIDLRGATKLKKLSMVSNLLQEIRDKAFSDLQNLRDLDLSNNVLQYIQPEAFKGAKNLTTLLLSNNKLKRVPEFTNLENLEMLMLNGNEITAVKSTSFLNLPKLQILSLANTSITQIHPTFLDKFPLLYELDLSRNQLTTLPADWLSPDSTLRRLHLDNNLFTNIETMSLNNATDIEYLNIAGNPFQLLSVKFLIQLPENTLINAEAISFNGDRIRRASSIVYS